MVGTQSLISKNAMNEIRNSGLAHLLSISGLHLSLAAAIFFMSTRFLLSYNSYLVLRYDIKKIAAAIAIFGTYFYLELADSPVPAVRSFIMVAFVLLAILFDQKADAKRSLAFAALVILLFNPYNVFSVSFQLSFAAILALISFHQFLSRFKSRLILNSIFSKFSWYLLEIILASLVAEIATLPFLIYHFKNFSSYGFLSNMVAIPLTSFTTMPLGFLSILLMPLGLEKFSLYLMGISITWLLDISHFVSNLDYAYFVTNQLPKWAFILSVIGFLIICLMKSKIKWAGALIFIASCSSIFFVKQPNLLFDARQKFFAIYSQDDGLIFSKKIRSIKKRDLWMKEMHENQFKYFEQFSTQQLASKGIECDEKKCRIMIDGKNILVLLQRNKLSEICFNDVDVVVNLTSKYELPSCFSEDKIKIDNVDFYKKGGQAIYFERENVRIKTAR